MLDPVTNFGKVVVSTGYDAAATSIVLQSGDGAKLPAPATDGAFNLVWWNSTQFSDPSDDPNKEIVRCTARSTDTLTITRAEEGTSATTKNAAEKTYKMILAPTKKLRDDIEAAVPTSDQKAALAGTSGTPSSTNKYATDADARLVKHPFVRKTATETLTNSATLQNDDQLLFAVAANESWVFEMCLDVTMDGVVGFKAAITVPSGATLEVMARGLTNNLYHSLGRSTTSGSAVLSLASTGSYGLVRIYGSVLNGSTPGNVTLQWAQGVDEAGSTSVLVGSTLAAHKV